MHRTHWRDLKFTRPPVRFPPDASTAARVGVAADDDAAMWADAVTDLMASLQSRAQGLSSAEAATRLQLHGPNAIDEERESGVLRLALRQFRSPLVLILVFAAIVSASLRDWLDAAVIVVVVLGSTGLGFMQEYRASKAVTQLRKRLALTVNVMRDAARHVVPARDLVPGDIVTLSAGNLVPADGRVLEALDFLVTEASLTGESFPVEKQPGVLPAGTPVARRTNAVYMGTSVRSGTAVVLVVHTGERTAFGAVAQRLREAPPETEFARGVQQFGALLMRVMVAMVLFVLIVNAWLGRPWVDSMLFAVALAVGLSPELLPAIISVTLSAGARRMAQRGVIVRHLEAIENLGSMDVLCTDKTGTLTQGKIVLEQHLDAHGDPSEKVLHYGYLNSFHHTGLKNLLDEAILDHEELEERLKAKEQYRKIDEIPFDFVRRRMSVVVQDHTGLNTLICKGAVDEVLSLCTRVEVKEEVIEVLPEHDAKRRQLADDLNGQGFRVIALAYKTMPNAPAEPVYSVKDESDLILLGFLAFLDPPKATATAALKRLHSLHVDVKVLTGDNEIITAHICKKVGVPVERLLLGSHIETMSETELAEAASATSVFARLVPAHKERIIRALQRQGHVVGFLGDGINDAPALKAADVGISVDSAVDIAKESSDIILLKHSLLVLEQGVLEGRRVFGNIVKYIKMAASSNFGNMFSVVGASAFLPFLPMLPIQVLINNLLYDFSQTAIPTDEVDAEWLIKPRQWRIDKIRRFILFIGPISSIFDYLTFFLMLYVFHSWNNPALFHTGWFVESLFTQTLIIHVIRTNKIPFIQSRASWPLIVTSVVIVALGAWLTISPLADTLGFLPLPPLYWMLLGLLLLGYAMLTQVVKTWFIRRFGE